MIQFLRLRVSKQNSYRLTFTFGNDNNALNQLLISLANDGRTWKFVLIVSGVKCLNFVLDRGMCFKISK